MYIIFKIRLEELFELTVRNRNNGREVILLTVLIEILVTSSKNISMKY